MFETILFDIKNDVARLTLNRPDRLNSFTTQMHQEVAAALATLVDPGAARVLVLTGAGRGFCAGQDLSDRAVAPGGAAVDLGHSLENYYNPMIRRLTDLAMPVICAVNGVAAGAGANIALACDIVIAARGAKFIQPFANIGLVPDSGGTWTMARHVGMARALGLSLTGMPLPADKALDWGLIWDVVDDGDLSATVDALAARLAQAPTQGLVRIKQAIRAGWSNNLDQQLDAERDHQRALGFTDDYREGVAAFLEKRQPRFTGH